MDGDITTTPPPDLARARAPVRAPIRARQRRRFIIVGVVLLLVLGLLYGFNAWREKSIAGFFANNKPPPAQIAAVIATSEAVPRFANGIGSLVAVHQVTVTPEVGGRVTEIAFESGAKVNAGDKLIQINR